MLTALAGERERRFQDLGLLEQDQVRGAGEGDERVGRGHTGERFLATRAVDPARLAEQGTLDRIATVDEVARVVEFFAGPLGAFVSGQVIRVDGGAQTWAA